MAIKVRQLVTELSLQGDAGDKFAKFGLAVDGVKKALGLVVQAFNVAKRVVFDFTSELASQGDEVAKAAKNIGVSAEALQELGFAAEISGANFRDVQVAIQRAAKGLNDARTKGTGPFKDALDQLNIGLEEFDGLEPDQIFERLSTSLSGLEDPTTKAALAQDLFGRGGKRLIPLLDEGAEGISALREEFKELGGGFTDDGAAAAEEFVDAQTRLNTVIDSLKIAIGTELFPILQEVIDEIREWTQNNKDLIKVRVREFLERLIASARQLLPVLQQVLKIFFDLLPLVLSFAEAVATVIESVGGLDSALQIAAGAWVGFQLATTAALGPVGLIAGAFAALLPIALELGDRLGDVAFSLSEVGKEAAILEAQAGGRTTSRDLRVNVLRTTSETNKAGQAFVRQELDQLSEVELTALGKQVESAGGFSKLGRVIFNEAVERKKRLAAIRKRREREQRQNSAAAARQERKEAQRKASRGSTSQEEEPITDEELLGLINQAAGTGTSLTNLLDGRKVPKGPPPVVTVTINNTNVDQTVEAPVTVNGVPGTSAEDVANLVREQQGALLEDSFRQALEDLQSPEAR